MGRHALKALDARMVVFAPKYGGIDNIKFFSDLTEELAIWPHDLPLNLKKFPNLKLVVNTGMDFKPG